MVLSAAEAAIAAAPTPERSKGKRFMALFFANLGREVEEYVHDSEG